MGEGAVFVDAKAVGAVLGDARRAGVEDGDAGVAVNLLQDLLVRVAIDQRGVLRQLRPLVHAVVQAGAIDVAVREEERPVVGRGVNQHVVIGHAREGEDHLVNLRLAIAAHGNDLVGNGVEHLYDALGRVVGREVVARAVVEQVAEKHHAVGRLVLDCGHKTLAGVGGAMDVGGNDKLHGRSLLHGGFFRPIVIRAQPAGTRALAKDEIISMHDPARDICARPSPHNTEEGFFQACISGTGLAFN